MIVLRKSADVDGAMDCRVIGERSDAVLWTALPGNDGPTRGILFKRHAEGFPEPAAARRGQLNGAAAAALHDPAEFGRPAA